jgi:hypothetical protein
MAEMYLRGRDAEAARQMLSLHLPGLVGVSVDWGACGCLRVTLLAVAVAKRIAENVAIALRARESMSIFMGHERDVDVERRAMTEGRVLELALICAGLMTDPAAEETVQWALPEYTREIREVAQYNKAVRAAAPEMVGLFRIHLEFRGLPDYTLEHLYTEPPKVKVSCWC